MYLFADHSVRNSRWFRSGTIVSYKRGGNPMTNSRKKRLLAAVLAFMMVMGNIPDAFWPFTVATVIAEQSPDSSVEEKENQTGEGAEPEGSPAAVPAENGKTGDDAQTPDDLIPAEQKEPVVEYATPVDSPSVPVDAVMRVGDKRRGTLTAAGLRIQLIVTESERLAVTTCGANAWVDIAKDGKKADRFIPENGELNAFFAAEPGTYLLTFALMRGAAEGNLSILVWTEKEALGALLDGSNSLAKIPEDEIKPIQGTSGEQTAVQGNGTTENTNQDEQNLPIIIADNQNDADQGNETEDGLANKDTADGLSEEKKEGEGEEAADGNEVKDGNEVRELCLIKKQILQIVF